MRRPSARNENPHRAVLALVGLTLLATLGCDNSMNFNPAAPEWPDWPATLPGTRTLRIDGVLDIAEDACQEATVLYDGLEVPGARSRCPDPGGCARLELEATLVSATGNHTISFQVLRQSREVLDYRAEGTVVVDREDVDLGGARLRLGPRQVPLAAGEAVTFDIRFTD